MVKVWEMRNLDYSPILLLFPPGLLRPYYISLCTDPHRPSSQLPNRFPTGIRLPYKLILVSILTFKKEVKNPCHLFISKPQDLRLSQTKPFPRPGAQHSAVLVGPPYNLCEIKAFVSARCILFSIVSSSSSGMAPYTQGECKYHILLSRDFFGLEIGTFKGIFVKR